LSTATDAAATFILGYDMSLTQDEGHNAKNKAKLKVSALQE